MSQIITISAVTANTPVNIYYCDSMSANCETVKLSADTFPYTFTVPDSASTTDFIIKIVDINNCEIGETVYITPTPTSSQTPTPTQTPTQTVTPTSTTTPTPTITPTNTITPTITPTTTPTPTPTPIISIHYIGKAFYKDSIDACGDLTTITPYFTYISECNTLPILGVVIYENNLNGVLYNPVNGGNKYIKMSFGVVYYSVRIDGTGMITDFNYCGV